MTFERNIPMARKKSYSNTNVPVSRSRAAIDELLKKWGVSGIQWEDNFEDGFSQIRFRWKVPDRSYESVARFRIDIELESKLEELAIDKRSGRFSEKKYQRLKNERGRREHRVLYNLLKNMLQAIEDKIIPADAIFLPWMEDSEGNTVYEKVAPAIASFSNQSFQKAISSKENP